MANKGGTKVRSSSENAGGKFPQGGKTPMFGKQHADQQTAGETSGTKAKALGKFNAGGSGHMFPKGSARKAEPGMTTKAVN